MVPEDIKYLTDFVNALNAIKFPFIILLAIYLTFRNIDKIQIWVSLIQKLFSYLSCRIERKSIANNIEGKINSFVRKLNNEFDGVLPYGIKLEWVEDKDITIESFSRENQIIVKMKQHVNQDRNLVMATLGFVSRGLMPLSRNYVSKPLLKSIDFKTTHKILLSTNENSAIEYLFREIVPIEVKDEPEIDEYLDKLHDIDDHGYFTTILFAELVILGKRLPPGVNTTRKRAIAEVKQLVDFLYTLAISAPGDEVDLDFIKKEIKLSIVIAAKQQKITMGEQQYLNRFKKILKDDCERIYLISTGVNIDFAKSVCSKVTQNFEVDLIFENQFKTLNRLSHLTEGYSCLFQKKSNI